MILITGFGPFGEKGSVAHRENPSEALANAAGEKLGARTEILPVRFDIGEKVPELVSGADLVLSIGVAGGRTVPRLEKLGVNWQEARTADVTGSTPTGQKIFDGGPDFLASGWDLDRIASECGIEISLSAGTYVCNTLSYSLYRHHGNSCFLHIPPAEHLALEEGVELVERIVECCMSA
ncbi:MAG: pyroglutamyl-peptidase I family protein [Flaviflexus sp.]|uniref:pyroglutamyl-peptidase I family protein n=1 Tax=Flaviflexus sp. TaxID=1969482 RepID=UPI003F8F5703